jgi:hypothetical protein
MDNGSKFGTLVLISRPWSFQNKLNESETIAVQIGRTVLDFNLKKSWRLFPLCYSGENEVVNVHRRENDQQPQQPPQALPNGNPPEQQREGHENDAHEQRPLQIIPNLPVPDYAAPHNQQPEREAGDVLDGEQAGNGADPDRDNSVVEEGVNQPDAQIVVEPVDANAIPAQPLAPAQAPAPVQPQPPPQQEQPPANIHPAVQQNPHIRAERELEIENVEEVARLENRPTTFVVASPAQNEPPAPPAIA